MEIQQSRRLERRATRLPPVPRCNICSKEMVFDTLVERDYKQPLARWFCSHKAENASYMLVEQQAHTRWHPTNYIVRFFDVENGRWQHAGWFYNLEDAADWITIDWLQTFRKYQLYDWRKGLLIPTPFNSAMLLKSVGL